MNLKSYLKGIGIGVIVTALILTIATRMNPNKMTDEDIKTRAKELGMVESSTLASSSGLSGQDNTISNTTDTDNKDSNENVSGSDNNNSEDQNVSDNNETNVTDDMNSSDNKDADASDNKDNNSADVNKSSDSKDTNATDDKNSTDNKNTDAADNKNTSDNKDSNVTDNKNTPDNKDTNTSDNKTSDSKTTGKTVTVEIKSGMSSESAAAAAKEAGLVDDDVEFNKYLCENGYDKRLRVGVHDIPEGSDFETISKYMCGMN